MTVNLHLSGDQNTYVKISSTYILGDPWISLCKRDCAMLRLSYEINHFTLQKFVWGQTFHWSSQVCSRVSWSFGWSVVTMLWITYIQAYMPHESSVVHSALSMRKITPTWKANNNPNLLELCRLLVTKLDWHILGLPLDRSVLHERHEWLSDNWNEQRKFSSFWYFKLKWTFLQSLA